MRYLAAAALQQRNLMMGQELRVRFADAPEQMRATLVQPDGRSTTLQASVGGGNYEIAIADTSLPGVYTLRAKVGGQDRVDRFVIRADPSESELMPLDEVRWTKLEQSLGFRHTGAGARALVAASVQPIRELWLPLLLGAFSLLLVELMLTRFWSEGRYA
jgi:hypothetical protein